MQTSSGLSLTFVLLCQSVLYKKKYKKYFGLCKLQGKIMLKISLTRNVRDMELPIIYVIYSKGFEPGSDSRSCSMIVR